MGAQPVGYRFYPTEEELVSFYLRNKLEGSRPELHRVIPVVPVYDLEPWDLPRLAGELCQRDTEQWCFFVPIQEREAKGGRPTRTTVNGYWKATGSPGHVYSSSNQVIGVKKTMVFYNGKAPNGRKTKWKLHEYRAIEDISVAESSTTISTRIPKLRYEFSLCRVYVISGSFRAFDRRPHEGAPRPARATTSASIQDPALLAERISSPETSNSGRGDQVDEGLPAGTVASSGPAVLGPESEPPGWDWQEVLRMDNTR